MADDLTDFLASREPSAQRPLLGLTVLVVEDSRFACDALRLLCLRSGARIRRAESLAAARRHLAAYRPTVAIIDLGLPDGSGLDLIAELAAMCPRVPALLGTSGDPGAETAAIAAGADGFLPKPIERLRDFQAAVLAALPPTPRPVALVAGETEDRVAPDPLAFRDDLAHAADLLDHRPNRAELDYLAQFLTGLARSARDAPLQAAAEALTGDHLAGRGTGLPISTLSGLLRERLAAGAVI